MTGNDPFDRGRAPRAVTREGRVSLLRELAEDLLIGRASRPEVRLFAGRALTAWLRSGGDLVRDHWKVAAPRGSHLQPHRISLIADERQGAQDEIESAK